MTAFDGARLAQAGVGLHDRGAAEFERLGQRAFGRKTRAGQKVAAFHGQRDGLRELVIERPVAAGEVAEGFCQVASRYHGNLGVSPLASKWFLNVTHSWRTFKPVRTLDCNWT